MTSYEKALAEFHESTKHLSCDNCAEVDFHGVCRYRHFGADCPKQLEGDYAYEMFVESWTVNDAHVWAREEACRVAQQDSHVQLRNGIDGDIPF